MNVELGTYTHSTHVSILEVPLILDTETRARHVYIAGRTGTGKSALLGNIAAQLAQGGGGFAFFDPHGDEAEKLLSRIPPNRADHLTFIDLADLSASHGINFMADVPPDRISVVADNFLTTFIAIFGRDAIGDRSQEVFRNALIALMERGEHTLLSVMRLLRDETFRRSVINSVKDPVCRSYWFDEFEQYDTRFREQVTAPILNKLDALLSHIALRNILSQPKSTVDLRKVMDEGKILIVSLRKGSVGAQAARFMGAIIFSGLAHAAFSRDDMPEEDRRPFDVVLDEAQSFMTPEVATVLSELRKYKLSLTMASQYLDQISPPVRSAIFGNAGTLVSFRLGSSDAEIMAKEFGLKRPDMISGLPNYRALVSTLSAGRPQSVLDIATRPPAPPIHRMAAKMLASSRNRATPRKKVESQIAHTFRA